MSDQSTLFEDLALKYSSLTDDENLVKFFSEVLARWVKLDKVPHWGFLPMLELTLFLVR